MKSARNVQEIGKLIKYHRQKFNYTQTEFAKKTGLTQVTISNIEHGIGGTLKALVSITNVLGIEITFQNIQKINSKSMLDYLE